MSQRWAMTPHAAETWAKAATEHPDLQQTLCFVLRSIDYPDAIETYVRWSAPKGGTFWDDAFESLDPLSSAEVPKIPVNPSTRTRLWTIVEHDPDQATRALAFQFWKRTATGFDLEQLRSIPATHPLFEEVLKVRLRLRDTTATNLLIERMKADPRVWCGYAPRFYEHEGVRDALFSNLEVALDDSQQRADAIAQHLPPNGVRDLLRTKSDLLRRLPRTWPFLWRSEVPEALVFVRDAVSQAHSDDLKLFFFRFGFPFPVTQQMLDTLVPGLDRFPKSERKRIAEAAIIAGFRQWAETHLPDVVFAEEWKNRWLTKDNVGEILTIAATAIPEGVLAVYRNSDFARLEPPFGSRDVVDIDVLEVLRSWLGASPDANRLIIAAMLLAEIGTSRDIEWWRSVEPSDDSSHKIWSNAYYILQRRRWQQANSERE